MTGRSRKLDNQITENNNVIEGGKVRGIADATKRTYLPKNKKKENNKNERENRNSSGD